MSLRALCNDVGWIAALLGATSAYVQFRRLRRNGAQGVSLATWTLFVYLAVFWTLYGIVVHSWQLVCGSAVGLILQLLILSRLRPWSRRTVLLRSLGVVALSCAVPAVLWGWSGAAAGAGAAGILTRAPQLLALVHDRSATGVSAGSWTVAFLVSILWVVYYAGAHLWAVLVVTAVAGGASLTIAILSQRRHKSRERVLRL